jgi:hypothetical protein
MLKLHSPEEAPSTGVTSPCMTPLTGGSEEQHSRKLLLFKTNPAGHLKFKAWSEAMSEFGSVVSRVDVCMVVLLSWFRRLFSYSLTREQELKTTNTVSY